MASPPSLPRQMPEKLTTAPISVRPLVSAAISCGMRRVTLAVMRSSRCLSTASYLFEHDLFGKPVPTFPDHALTAGHRREERNLAGAGNHAIRLDMGVVDRGADHPRRIEGIGVGLATSRKPRHQIVDGADAGRRFDRLLRFADPFAHPGEIFDLHASSSLMR